MLPPPLQARLSPYMNHYASIPTSFAGQAAHGFSSSNFDLEGNIAGDSRAGLDDSVLAEIRDIMHREHVKCVQFYPRPLLVCLSTHSSCSFDEARLIRHKINMARNGVDPRTGEALRVQRLLLRRHANLVFCPGLPTDAKAITRL